MKKLAILIMLLIFASACAPVGKQPLLNYKTGTAGITMKFANNAPPNEIIENNEFEIAFILDNNGAYDVTGTQGIIRVVTDQGVQLTDPDFAQILKLEGRSPQNPDGAEKVISFKARARPLPTQSDIIQSQIFGLVCYPYKAEATADICVDTDVYGQIAANKKPCVSKSVSLSGQGGPVAITKVDMQLIPQGDSLRPQFTISIVNQGKGYVVQQDILQRLCQGTASEDEKSGAALVTIVDATLGENPVSCQPSEVKLKDGQATFTCTTLTPIPKSTPPFLSSFAMSLAYGYIDAVGKTISIKRSPLGASS